MRRLTKEQRARLLGMNLLIAAEERVFAVGPGYPTTQRDAMQEYNKVLIAEVERLLSEPTGTTPDARAVKVRPSRAKPGMRVKDQYLEVVLPDGQVLPEVIGVKLIQEMGYLTQVQVLMNCGGILPAADTVEVSGEARPLDQRLNAVVCAQMGVSAYPECDELDRENHDAARCQRCLRVQEFEERKALLLGALRMLGMVPDA